jgi:hypothetical protein
MHLKVFVKLKNPKNPLVWAKKPKKTPKNPKNPKKPKKPKKNQKNPKKPTGLVFFLKTRVFSNPACYHNTFSNKIGEGCANMSTRYCNTKKP